MEFDSFSIALLILRPDAPNQDEEAATALQDAHLAHLAWLHEAGYALAAGPFLGPSDRDLRGLTILRVEPDEARELCERDPAVRAGRFSIQVVPWMVPRGALSYSRTRFPHSVAEAGDG
jgi:uncharacterized protein YciI